MSPIPEAEKIWIPTTGDSEHATPALWLGDATAQAQLVLAHGAGAGMRHEAMERLARGLLEHGIATLRFDFPYMAAGRRRPDRASVLERTVREVTAWAVAERPRLPLFAGGRSMGGRMTTRADAAAPLAGVRGFVLFAFPLHPANRPGTERAEHLIRVHAPLLFLQGSRDRLATLELLRSVLAPLAERARLHLVEGADHSFHVLKSSGRNDADIEAEIVAAAADWMQSLLL